MNRSFHIWGAFKNIAVKFLWANPLVVVAVVVAITVMMVVVMTAAMVVGAICGG